MRFRSTWPASCICSAPKLRVRTTARSRILGRLGPAALVHDRPHPLIFRHADLININTTAQRGIWWVSVQDPLAEAPDSAWMECTYIDVSPQTPVAATTAHSRRSRVPSQTAQQAQSIAPLRNNCRTIYMLTDNVDYHDLGAGDFTRRNLDVSYSGSPTGNTLGCTSGSTHPTDPLGQAAAEPHRSLSSQAGCVRLCGPGRVPGATCTASTPASTASPARRNRRAEGRRAGSPPHSASRRRTRTLSFDVIGKPRPGNVQRRRQAPRQRGAAGPYPTAVSARRGPCRRRQTRHTRGKCSCGCRFANSAAILRRPGAGGFVRLPTWLSRR
jgi:hypothetical protein